MEKNINYEMCKECGGACCKQVGCIYMPGDFRVVNFKAMKKILDKGNISISGQPFSVASGLWSYILYPKARDVNADVIDLMPTGGPCKLLTPTGCSLSEDDRPSLGLACKPTKIGGPCEAGYTQDDLLSWMDYDDVLSGLVEHYTGKDVLSVIAEQAQAKADIICDKIDSKQELLAMEKKVYLWCRDIINTGSYIPTQDVKRMILL